MASQTNPDNELELSDPDDEFDWSVFDTEYEMAEIEIYTPLMPQDLADILAHPSSPVSIETDEDDCMFTLKCPKAIDPDAIDPGGYVERYDRYDPSRDIEDSGIEPELYKVGQYTKETKIILETMKGEPKSSMWTEANMDEPDMFIPNFRPVIDYLRSRGIEFCVIGRDEDCHASLIGHHKDGKTVIDKDFKYDHKKILE